MGTSRRQSAAFATVACMLAGAALFDPIDASQKIPMSNVSDSEPGSAVLASELLELDMSRTEAEALLRRFGFCGGICNLNCGSADGVYSLRKPNGETMMLSYGIADATGMRHLERWCVWSGGASLTEPRMFSALRAFKLVDVSTSDEWPSCSTIHSGRGSYPPIETGNSIVVPLLTTP